MIASSRCLRLGLVSGAALLAAAAGSAGAADCRLVPVIHDTVLLPGESAPVSVYAEIPADMYAFASSNFAVGADFSSWSAASAGLIIGPDVVAIDVSQDHNPPAGVLADPARPFHVWSGEFTPISYEPRLVRVMPTPYDFFVYPSDLTSSAVACETRRVRRPLFINPVRVGQIGVAPGAGTTMSAANNDGSFWFTSDSGTTEAAAVSHGVSVLAWARVEGVSPDIEPAGGSITVGAQTEPFPMESFSLNYAKVPWPSATGEAYEFDVVPGGFDDVEVRLYRNHASVGNVLFGDGSVRFASIPLDLIIDLGVDGESEPPPPPPPPPSADAPNPRNSADGSVRQVSIDLSYPIPTTAFLPNGEEIEVDRVEYIATVEAENLWLSYVSITEQGTPGMRGRFDAPCSVADLAPPFGVLDLNDVSRFVEAFSMNASIADIADPQGILDLADINAFISRFNAGCP